MQFDVPWTKPLPSPESLDSEGSMLAAVHCVVTQNRSASRLHQRRAGSRYGHWRVHTQHNLKPNSLTDGQVGIDIVTKRKGHNRSTPPFRRTRNVVYIIATIDVIIVCNDSVVDRPLELLFTPRLHVHDVAAWSDWRTLGYSCSVGSVM